VLRSTVSPFGNVSNLAFVSSTSGKWLMACRRFLSSFFLRPRLDQFFPFRELLPRRAFSGGYLSIIGFPNQILVSFIAMIPFGLLSC